MDFINFVIGIISLSVHIIFLYKREWLFDKQFFSSILLTALLMLVVSEVLLKLEIGNPKFIAALGMPFFAGIVFFAMKIIFFNIYRRNPEDTFWSMDLSLMRDGIFNALFWFLGIMIPVFLIYFLHI